MTTTYIKIGVQPIPETPHISNTPQITAMSKIELIYKMEQPMSQTFRESLNHCVILNNLYHLTDFHII
jgi:hypothetical protein